jgi:hypothetical protein
MDAIEILAARDLLTGYLPSPPQQPAEFTPEGLADTARHIQQRAGDEFQRGSGDVLRQPLRDRSSSGTGHPEFVAVSAQLLRSASSARAAWVP